MTGPDSAFAAGGKPIRVMIVDDSPITCNLLAQTLKKERDIEITNVAFNGKMAIALLKDTPVDVVLLDIEMPEMDGLAALPELLKLSPHLCVIMLSRLTLRHAEISLRALMLGACDTLAKPSSQHEEVLPQFFEELLRKIRALVSAHSRSLIHTPMVMKSSLGADTAIRYPEVPIKAIAIGCSTGGTQALDVVFKGLAVQLPMVPIFITLHMPPAFTSVLAQHISMIAGKPCTEATHNEPVEPGRIYLAPGDYHMVPELQNAQVCIMLNQNPPVNFCRPSVDTMLGGLSAVYGRYLLAVILTGMGSDGLAGARAVVRAKGTVIAQDARTSVVWGMPRVVAEEKLCSAVLPIQEIAPYILKSCA